MEPIRDFFGIDWKAFGITIFVALLGFQAIIQVLHWFLFEFLGIETKAMREKKEEHKLLINTVKEVKELSKQREEDVWQSIKHDKKIQENLDQYMEEIRKAITDTQNIVNTYSENRVHDRKQSLQIQQELKDNISQIVKSDEEEQEQIKNLIQAQKESLADRINQKYKFYLSNNGIPEDEVEEFINLHFCYKKCGGNHLGDAKFNYCMEHLPVIPAVVKFDEMKSHTNQNIEKDEFHRK